MLVSQSESHLTGNNPANGRRPMVNGPPLPVQPVAGAVRINRRVSIPQGMLPAEPPRYQFASCVFYLLSAFPRVCVSG